MTQLEKRVFPMIFVLAIIAYIMSIVMPNSDFGEHWLIREDGVLEWFTALALLATSLLCVYRFWTLRRSHPRSFLTCTAVGAAVLFFGMGEELSWGQRMLGIESPEFFITHNAQNETNLHNLVVGETKINKLIFGKILGAVVVLYLLLPLAHQRSPRLRSLINHLAIPAPRVQHILAILAIVVMVETSSASKRGEIKEFALSSLLLLAFINPHNRSIFRPGARLNGDDAQPQSPARLATGPEPEAQPATQRRAA